MNQGILVIGIFLWSVAIIPTYIILRDHVYFSQRTMNNRKFKNPFDVDNWYEILPINFKPPFFYHYMSTLKTFTVTALQINAIFWTGLLLIIMSATSNNEVFSYQNIAILLSVNIISLLILIILKIPEKILASYIVNYLIEKNHSAPRFEDLKRLKKKQRALFHTHNNNG